MGWWTDCIDVFEKIKMDKDRWPGIFKPAKAYCNNKDIHQFLPEFAHWFDKETIAKEVEAQGIFNRKNRLYRSCWYISRHLLFRW